MDKSITFADTQNPFSRLSSDVFELGVMADDQLVNNPFAALFPTVQEARQFRDEIDQYRDLIFGTDGDSESITLSRSTSSDLKQDSPSSESQAKHSINNIIENIFLITVDEEIRNNPDRPTRCVFLTDLRKMLGDRDWLDLDYLEEAVFERLMLEDPIDSVILTRGSFDDQTAEKDAGEKCKMRYLYMCYYRCIKQKSLLKVNSDKGLKECQNVIITNSRMVFCHPEIYEGPATAQQFIDILLEYSESSLHHEKICDFLELVFKDVDAANQSGEEDVSLGETCTPILDILLDKFRNYSLIDVSLFRHLQIVHFFSRVPCLAKVFLDHSNPRSMTLGNSFELTLLGSILRITCLPRSEVGPFEFFDQPSQRTQQEHNITEANLWIPLNNLVVELYETFNRLLRTSPEIRHQFLTWLANCLQSNSGRAKLWTHVQSILSTDVSDGFVLNLGAVLLHLCKPFAQPFGTKLLRIDPAYCTAEVTTNEEARQRSLYLRELHQETCLITAPDGEQPSSSTAVYNFSTVCFFLTHRCLSLGFSTLQEKFLRLNQDLVRVQRLYEEARAQGGQNSDAVQNIKNSMERGMSMLLSMKTAMLEPNNLELMLTFHISTATWLIHVATGGTVAQQQQIKFPLPEAGPLTLSCIPEFMVDNLADFIIFLRRFSIKNLELCGEDLNHLMTFILVFMGSPERMRNPHLRAKLAEMLEALMPHQDNNRFTPVVSLYNREKLFAEHPNIQFLVSSLLSVFVSIEMTGQSVAFEQKLKYRRPMYVLMDYIWKIDVHRQAFKALADDAEQNMESIRPPLFLRFINLLINDAIFLLDEALQYMARLREGQQLRDSGGLQELPIDQRQENEAEFQRMGALARFHNSTGNATIHVLELITQEIRSIFTHPAMVDRIAAMLNHFLLNLVGPKKKQLKVRDLTEYEFKPHDLVRDICLIYIHLGNSSDFCIAVSHDGRSYSPELFVQAEQVLSRIGQASLITQIQQLAVTVHDLAVKQKAEEEVLGEAPDEFLDPIMGTVMVDPVILPSSKVTMDRATIARHILSDQTDPFNRSPLTMDKVIPNTELKQRIEKWVETSKKK